MGNPMNSTYLGRWMVNSFNMWALCAFVVLNPWMLLLECEAMELDEEGNDGPSKA